MASQHLVTPDQAAVAGPAAGFCYYCGAPLGALHHSYCTLIKALPPTSENSISSQYHPQYGAHTSTSGAGFDHQMLPPDGSQGFSVHPSPAVEGHFEWQPSQWAPPEQPPAPSEEQGWPPPAPPSSPPPPPPDAEGPPPAPPSEEGHIPPPPLEQPPPPPEEPAAEAWEASLPWNAASSRQPDGGAQRWAHTEGSFGHLRTDEAAPGQLGYQDTPASGLHWEQRTPGDGSAQRWQGRDAWNQYGGPEAAASQVQQTPHLEPSLQQHQGGASVGPGALTELSHSSNEAQSSLIASAPWHQPSAHLQSSSGPPVSAAQAGSAHPVQPGGQGFGMESIRDLYSAAGQYLPTPQMAAHPGMMQTPPYMGAQDPQFALSHVGTLPFPLLPTPPPASLPEEPSRVDARDIFKKPGRSTRPDRFVVILRGLPGSGKSHLAKALRDVEVMNGGSAPRVHTMDEYFITEVEKEVEVEDSRGKKRKTTKAAMEYLYEPELEQAYCQSMLKAFKKTLEEGRFHFVVVDYWNLVVSDFEPYWKAAKSSGFEVYVLQPAKLDPETCAKRNIHNFSLEEVTQMSRRWEPLPAMYLQLDIASLFKGDLLDTGDIAEVEMDSEPERDQEAPTTTGKRPLYETDDEDDGTPHHEPPSRPSARPQRGAIKGRPATERSDTLVRSQKAQPAGTAGGREKARRRKEVKWADLEGEKEAAKGFRIGVDLSKKRKLEIGPGAGYSEDQTGPLQRQAAQDHAVWAKKVKAQVRDEAEAFKAVLARRRQRVGLEEEDD